MQVTLTGRNQITIPRNLIKDLGFKPGDEFDLQYDSANKTFNLKFINDKCNLTSITESRNSKSNNTQFKRYIVSNLKEGQTFSRKLYSECGLVIRTKNSYLAKFCEECKGQLAKEYGVKDHPCKYINEEVENKKDCEVKITEIQSQEVKIDKSKIEDVKTKSVESNLNTDIKEEFKSKHNKNTVIENIILGEEKCYLKCAHCNQFFNKGYLLDKVFYCKDCAKKDFLNYLNKVKKEKMKNV